MNRQTLLPGRRSDRAAQPTEPAAEKPNDQGPSRGWGQLWRGGRTTTSGSSSPSSSPRGQQAWTTQTSALAVRASTVLLWALLAAGPLGLVVGVLALSGTSTTAPAVNVRPEDNDRGQVAASALAEDFVVAWLSTPRSGPGGGPEQLQPFTAATITSTTLPEAPWSVREATTAQAREISTDETSNGSTAIWNVVVAVTVEEPQDAAGAGPTEEAAAVVAQRRFFQVAVSVDTAEDTRLALTLPSPVAAPAAGTPPTLAYDERISSSSPLASAAGEFLTGLLVEGDVTRITSPGAEINPVLPAPYTAVNVEEVSAALGDLDTAELENPTELPEDGTSVQLLVQATATSPVAAGAPERVTAMTYALTLTARQGRWEVSALDPAPALAPDNDGTTEQPVPSTNAPANGASTPGTPSTSDPSTGTGTP